MEKLTVRRLNKTFVTDKHVTVPAIQDMEFTIHDGEFVCFVGPSGCGKTTMLRILAGLEEPTSGEISWNGTQEEKKIGFVFQSHSLLPWRTVYGNIAFGLEIQKRDDKEIAEKVTGLIALMNLKGFEGTYPKELSGGMQKRVAIARALAIDPDIMLMDEPFVSLDAQTRNVLQKELLKVWEETNNTIIFITHNVDEAVYLADRVIILSQRPTRVKEEVHIPLPRPRDRTDNAFIGLRKDILEKMNY